ncbi:Hypothetical protein NTJ_11563 [Nesidiocoris tenuis]|uniref:Uncharacterized protein n=1 Tax=Nesidiocoris tenuis TaxID=355587 RepID=A0ABN7B3D6_9HEMI|nr:Hypothetical protein NTJ_11563 [Nesidiocoris tenuis]
MFEVLPQMRTTYPLESIDYKDPETSQNHKSPSSSTLVKPRESRTVVKTSESPTRNGIVTFTTLSGTVAHLFQPSNP